MSRNPADKVVTLERRIRRTRGFRRGLIARRRRLVEALSAARGGEGFTLTELLISIVIISVGIVGFASAIGLASMEMWYGRRDTDISMLVTQRLERLKATPYASLQSGEQTEGDIRLSWVVEGSQSKKITLAVDYHGSSGLSRADTVVAFVMP